LKFFKENVLGNTLKNASSEAFRAVMFKVEVFWVVTPCSVVAGHQHYTASQPRRPRLETLKDCRIVCRFRTHCRNWYA